MPAGPPRFPHRFCPALPLGRPGSSAPTRPFPLRSVLVPALAVVALVATVLAATGCIARDDAAGGPSAPTGGGAFQPLVYDPPELAPSLDALVDTAGRPFSLAELRGRVVLVNFGYTHCPDVCPTTLALDREVLRARPETVAVVFVTVDPERDMTTSLANYLRFFDAPIVGVTGTRAAVAAAAKAWGVTVVLGERDAAGNYPVLHSAGTYVIDPQGRRRFLYPYGTPAEILVAAVDDLADEPRSEIDERR